MTQLLSELEKTLVNSAVQNQMLDLNNFPVKEIRAAVLSRLVRGEITDTPIKRVRIDGGIIVGNLDIGDVQDGPSLHLRKCSISKIFAVRSNLRHLNLENSTFSELIADRLITTHDLDLSGVTCSGISIGFAEIGGRLSLDDARIGSIRDTAVEATGVEVRGHAFLRRLQVHCASGSGALYFEAAVFKRGITLDGSEVINSSGPAFFGDGMQVGGVMFIQNFFFDASSDLGSIRLLGATIKQNLQIVDGELFNDRGAGLNARNAHFGGNVLLRQLSVGVVSTAQAAIQFATATVDGQLAFDELTVGNEEGEAINISSATVAGLLSFTKCSVSGVSRRAALEAVNIRTSSVQIDRTHIFNRGGVGFLGELLQARCGIRITRSTIHGAGELGALSLSHCIVEQAIEFDDCLVQNFDGPGLVGEGMFVSKDFKLGPRVTLIYNSRKAAGLALGNSVVNGSLYFESVVVENSADVDELLDLSGLKVQGLISLDVQRILLGMNTKILLDQMTYAGLPDSPESEIWIKILRENTLVYAAQPYRQLVSGHMALGHLRDSQRISIAQQEDLLVRGQLGSLASRTTHRLSGIFVGYGYRHWRAFGFLLATLVLAIAVAFSAGYADLTDRSASDSSNCGVSEQLSLTFPVAGPILRSNIAALCQFDTEQFWGQVYFLSNAVLQLFGWAFLTLFIAGFTGIIKKS